MKTKLYSTLIAIGCFINILCIAQSATPNGNFETWNIGYYQNPQYYIQTSNTQTYSKEGKFNCLRTSDAYHGNYAVKIITDSAGTDTSAAYFINATGGNNGPPTHGGVPYTQTPTGIKGYYKSAVPAGDTALILVTFSKGGSNIVTAPGGYYILKIYGTHSTYTPFSLTFSPALAQASDSVIFGAVSSDILQGNFSGLPGSMLQLDSVSFTGVASQPAELNGDFENWVSDTIASPVSWYNGNNGGSSATSLFQTTDAEAGNYAVEMKTVLGNRNNRPAAQSGQVSTGYYPNCHTGNCQEKGGYLYNTIQIDTLAFWYKYVSSAVARDSGKIDSGMVNLNFIKHGVNIWGTGQNLPPSATYKYMEVPFNISQVPDTAIVSFQSSSWRDTSVLYVGSVLKVDQVHFKSQPFPAIPTPTITAVGVLLTSTPSSGYQWYLNGALISGATSPTLTAVQDGSYTVKVTSGGATSAASNTVTLTNIQPVIIQADTVLTSSNVAGNQWYLNGIVIAGATSQVFTATHNGTYTVKVTTGGIASPLSATVAVTGIAPAAPPLCMVTADSLSQYNDVYWDKTPYTNVDSFIVYRETTSNAYKRIGAVAYDSLSMFIDTVRHLYFPFTGDPNAGTYRYRLQIRDKFGNYTALGNYHNTIFVTQTGGAFSWNNYQIEGEATPIPELSSYSLYRDDNNTGNWHVINAVSGSQLTINDANYASYPNGRWRIETEWGINCTSLRSATRTSSSSNVIQLRTSGIEPIYNNNTLFVYPNPSNGIFSVKSQTVISTVEVLNVIGEIVLVQQVNALSATIDLSGQAKGIYFYKINGNSTMLGTGKMVIE